MRATLTALTLLGVAAATPLAATAGPACPRNPMTQAHEPWMKMPTGAVDLHTAPPASATNPLMVGRVAWVVPPAASTPDVRRCSDVARAIGACNMK